MCTQARVTFFNTCVHDSHVTCWPSQAKEAEVAKCALERQNQELGYANRKLAAELDAAHDAARTASERDKRALQNLRDGLASVSFSLVSSAQHQHQHPPLLPKAADVCTHMAHI